MYDTAMRERPPQVFTDGPGSIKPVTIWEDGQPRHVELRWGLRPFESGGKSFHLLRSDGRVIGQRCLLPLTEFFLRPGSAPGNKRRKVTWAGRDKLMCAAGYWQPETDDWPAAFAALTVDAYPDIAPYQDRHIAIVHEDDLHGWLSGQESVERILYPLPLGSFKVSGSPINRMGCLV